MTGVYLIDGCVLFKSRSELNFQSRTFTDDEKLKKKRRELVDLAN